MLANIRFHPPQKNPQQPFTPGAKQTTHPSNATTNPYVRAMSQDLYSSRVLELAADIPLVGLLEGPDGRSHRVSRLCGSEIELNICLQDGQVVEAGIEPKACALGQASASILMRHIVGTTPAELRAARDAFKAMLKGEGPAPTGRFWELRYLEAVKEYPPRHTSVLLAFEAAVEACERALAKQQASLGEI